MILQNDHSKQTPKAHYALLQNKPGRRLNNIWLPMAMNLQPPSRLGKRASHNALAKSMGMAKKHYNSVTTLQGRLVYTGSVRRLCDPRDDTKSFGLSV